MDDKPRILVWPWTFFCTFQLTGLKIYLKMKTGICESRIRAIGKTTIITGADSGKYLSLVRYQNRKNTAWHCSNTVKWESEASAVNAGLSNLVVRVPGYRSTGPGFDSRRYHIFWEVVCLERGPLSLVRITEELFQPLTEMSTGNVTGG
jgi:hypothetical protein